MITLLSAISLQQGLSMVVELELKTSSSLCDFWQFSSLIVVLCLALSEFYPMHVELKLAKYCKASLKQFWNSLFRKSTFSISVGLAFLNAYVCCLRLESAMLYLESLCLCYILECF